MAQGKRTKSETWESGGPIPRWIDEVDKRRDTGYYYPLPVQDVGLGSSLPKDAFNRVQVADPVTIFDSQQQYDESPLLWETTLTGSATETHVADESAVDLAVTTASGDKASRQTRQYFRYQPGKSQLSIVTFNFGDSQANTVKRAGYFDDENGFFLKEVNGTVSVVKRSNITGTPVDTEVAQTAWNVDAMDGDGLSQLTLDITKSQIFFVSAEWLGVGDVAVGFFIGRHPRVVHVFSHANRSGVTTTYTTTHNLPVRYEIENTGAAAAAATLKAICCSVISEGGIENDRGYPFSTSNGATTINVGAGRRPVLSIRPKSTFNSIVNRATIQAESSKLISFGNPSFVEVVYNGSLTNASFASVDASSVVDRDIDATAITGGIVIDSFFVPGGSAAQGGAGANERNLQSKLPLVLDAAGANPINLSVVVTNLSATASVAASLTWTEFR